MIRSVAAVGLVAPLLLAAPPPKADPTPLVGTWRSVRVVNGGEEWKGGPLLAEFRADGTAVLGDGSAPRDREEPVKYTAAPDKTPAEIDVAAPAGRRAAPVVGIYKLDKDTLTLCYSRGGARPTAFESKPSSGVVLVTFERAQPKAGE
ncbi:MAG TPA: TIGR03067 domain-containing protein [Gemmataceae bacterium]|jgi:uncharacterized protein (TIGR03067 family)|nr:TIGR03067 domain-containing protein [Gemmataceae bacterium]